MSQLFLDCDGVLADFDLHAERLFGRPSREAEAEIGGDEFWLRVRSQENFYGRLPLMEDARGLVEAVKHLNPVILTGCPRGGWAEPQKLEWAKEHLPGTVVICATAAQKLTHMQPGDVLVDDYLRYRHLLEEAGGTFVHHRSARETVAELRQIGMLDAE